MTNASAANSPKPTYDAQGREVFTVHPEILSGGAPYRKVARPLGAEGGSAPSSSVTSPADEAAGPVITRKRAAGSDRR